MSRAPTRRIPLGLGKVPVAARRLTALSILLGAWEVLSRLEILDPFYMPAPSRVAGVIVELFASGRIWTHLEATFAAALLGLLLGIAIGAALGFLAALMPLVSELLEPVMILLNAIPRVILAPLFVIWLGIGLGSKVALAFLLVAVLTFFAVYNGIKEVDVRLVERVRTLGGGRWTLLREVYLPSVMSWILGNLRVAVGFAFTGAVVGEFVASSRGLGYLLAFAQSQFNAALTLALITLILVFVLMLFGITGSLERYVLRWRYR